MLAFTGNSFKLFSPILSSTSHRFPSSNLSSPRPSSARASVERSGPDFPYLPPAHRALILNLLATVDDRLGSDLLPSAVPSDVLRFQNRQGSAHGSVDIRTGSQTSPFFPKCPRVVGGEGEKECLESRDGLIKRKAVEIDLAANLPRMFGPEVAQRVVAEIQKAFRV